MRRAHGLAAALREHRLSMMVDWHDDLITVELRPQPDSDLLCPVEGRGVDMEDAMSSALLALVRRLEWARNTGAVRG